MNIQQYVQVQLISIFQITYDDIRKTYGGGTNRVPCYSWSSSANAYMLMYRQINKERNVDAYSKEALPQHIKARNINYLKAFFDSCMS